MPDESTIDTARVSPHWAAIKSAIHKALAAAYFETDSAAYRPTLASANETAYRSPDTAADFAAYAPTFATTNRTAISETYGSTIKETFDTAVCDPHCSA